MVSREISRHPIGLQNFDSGSDARKVANEPPGWGGRDQSARVARSIDGPYGSEGVRQNRSTPGGPLSDES